jgi:putative two-component system response regulator
MQIMQRVSGEQWQVNGHMELKGSPASASGAGLACGSRRPLALQRLLAAGLRSDPGRRPPDLRALGMRRGAGPADTEGAFGSRSPRETEIHADGQIRRMKAALDLVARERDEALKHLESAHLDGLFRLALAADFKDDDTGVHIVRMGFLSEKLALVLGCSRSWAKTLGRAAPMHDIGKIGIPDAVLKKPGRFDPQDREVMMRHPRIGADIIGESKIPLFQLAAEVALSHHERFDGAGYPSGLAGERIPLSGRIVAIVDFFDALTMDRCYRKALPDEQVKAMMLHERGRTFDPNIVDTFIALWSEFAALRDHVTHLNLSFGDLLRGPRVLPPLTDLA